MKKAIIPGSFDPVTLGHEDIIRRASEVFDKVTVLILSNSEKNQLFTPSERYDMIKFAVGDNEKIDIESFDGLTADYCKNNGVSAIVKGVRNPADFEYERQIAFVNKSLCDVDTFFLFASPETQFISSTVIKEMFKYGKPVDKMVSNKVCEYINNKLSRR